MHWSPIRIFQLGMLRIYLTPDLTPANILGHFKNESKLSTRNSSQLMLIVMNCWWVYPEPEEKKVATNSNFIQRSESFCHLKLFLRVIFMQGRACQLRPPQMVKRNVNFWWLDKNCSKTLKINGKIKGTKRVLFNSYENQGPTSWKIETIRGIFPLLNHIRTNWGENPSPKYYPPQV